MNDYQKYINVHINALRKCAKEHENDITSFAHIRVSDLCRDTANLLEELEQESKKGHWILTDVEGNKVWHCHCSECGKDPQNYVGGSENWWLIKNNFPKFCPSCGSDNREVEV